MIVRVEVQPRSGQPDTRGANVLRQASTLGVTGLSAVNVHDLYFLGGEGLTDETVDALVSRLLRDPVTQQASWSRLDQGAMPAAQAGRVEVTPLPGVTDSEAESLLAAAHEMGIDALQQAATGTSFQLQGELADGARRRLARGLLANEVVQAWSLNDAIEPPFVATEPAGDAAEIIPVRGADDAGLLAISAERRLALDLAEMQTLQGHFEEEGRDPTDLELEMFAQTWSEHCVHKTFKARIEFQLGDGPVQVVDSIYKTYIKAATKAADSPWLRSVFVDNAGIVGFDDNFDLAFKVETHNHPSALEPFGGANTGVGGVVRDVLGVSARPIATTDVLCFGPQDMDPNSLPEGVLHPRRIADGVVSGVADYGNKMGIPTVNGAVLYDPGYTANPLVFCGCLGILPRNSHPTAPQPGDLVISMGGRTGRDGIRGATFSSMEMDTETSLIAGSSVQIGHPIHEKQVLEVVLRARDERLYTAITDCGAGGLSSAVGEMSEGLGAVVQLHEVPVKYPGLQPWEVWLSEAQERMVLAVPQANWARLQELCAQHGVEAVSLGAFNDSGRLVIYSGDKKVGDLDLPFLHDGLPQRQLVARWDAPSPQALDHGLSGDLTPTLLGLLASPDIRSKEDIVRRYDHEVQGGTVLKPFVGLDQQGPSDATVLWPLDAALADPTARKGVALSVGVNPQYATLDPYRMAHAAVDEAMRNLVSVGADPGQVALLDNFCWGNPKLPDRLGGLVLCARGCFDAAVALEAPYISGKDSFNNEYTGADGKKHAIPGTILISALGIVPDVDKTVTMDLKRSDSLLYLVGTSAGELGGSALGQLLGLDGGEVPAPVTDSLLRFKALYSAIDKGLVRACHDCSEGGLAVAAAEMVIAGGVGLQVTLPAGLDAADGAFCESLSRFLVEVAPESADAFEQALDGQPCQRIGGSTPDASLVLSSAAGEVVIQATRDALQQAWRGHIA